MHNWLEMQNDPFKNLLYAFMFLAFRELNSKYHAGNQINKIVNS